MIKTQSFNFKERIKDKSMGIDTNEKIMFKGKALDRPPHMNPDSPSPPPSIRERKDKILALFSSGMTSLSSFILIGFPIPRLKW